MNLTARFIPILIIFVGLFTACQQDRKSSPGDSDAPGGSTQQDETTSLNQPTPTQQSLKDTQKDPDVEEYSVYSKLIANEFKGGEIKQVLIMDQTGGVSQGLLELNLREWGITPDKETVDSFLARNQESNPLKPNLDLALDYQLLSQEEVDEFQPQSESGGWDVFNEKYPDASGFLTLSKVGFNSDLSQALVFFKLSLFDQLLEGGYYFMVWQDGEWVVDSSYVFNT